MYFCEVRENKELTTTDIHKLDKPKKKVIVSEHSDKWLANCEYSKPDLHLFKKNVRAVLNHVGISCAKFWKIAQSEGVVVSRQGFFRDQVLRFPSYLWLGTYSRLTGVPVYRLLDPNLPTLLDKGIVVPKILHYSKPK